MVYGHDNKLLYMLHPEGTVSRTEGSAGTSYTYNYFKTDHLGSTRVMLSAVDGALQASQTTDYYPFGLSFENNNLNKNKYLFSGKEFQDGQVNGSMLGWYDFGARFYDPVLGRWFNVDPAAQVANPYLFCGNAPMMYIDKDGRIFWMIPAIAIGAAIGAASYTMSIAFSEGGFQNWNWGGFFQSIGIGAASGAITSGIGKIFKDVGKFGTEVARGLTHGLVQGGFSELQGGDFLSGFATGALSSWAGTAFQTNGIGKTKVGMFAFAGVAGGIGSEVTGGDFWKGAATGLTIAGLNHAAHSLFEGSNHMFASKEEAYAYMNKSSYKGGKPYKEHFVYELEDGRALLVKRTYNTKTSARTYEHNLSRGDGKVYYKDGWFRKYAVDGTTHTHPIPVTQGIGISPADKAFISKWQELDHKVIYQGKLHRIWETGHSQEIGVINMNY